MLQRTASTVTCCGAGVETEQAIDFRIEHGSTYTYLSVARIGRLAAHTGMEVRWQPFFVVPIMAGLGMTQGPFLPYPRKTACMWRDIERRAARQGIPCSRPSTYPVNSLWIARIACIAAEEGWCQVVTGKAFELHRSPLARHRMSLLLERRRSR